MFCCNYTTPMAEVSCEDLPIVIYLPNKIPNSLLVLRQPTLSLTNRDDVHNMLSEARRVPNMSRTITHQSIFLIQPRAPQKYEDTIHISVCNVQFAKQIVKIVLGSKMSEQYHLNSYILGNLYSAIMPRSFTTFYCDEIYFPL